MSLRHLLLAAASPLCLVAGPAWAETAISTAVTTPVTTATAAGGARDDVKVSRMDEVRQKVQASYQALLLELSDDEGSNSNPF